MVDFGSKLSSYVKSEAQTFVQKNINKLAGQLSGMGGGVINSLIGSVAGGLAQNLMDIGNSFNTVEAVAAQKMDGIVSGGDPEYAAGGKCADRSTVADISSMRNPSGESLKSYQMNVFPETVIEQKNTWDEKYMNVLDRSSSTYFMKFRFYKYERSDLFDKAKSPLLYTVDLPLPTELTDAQKASYKETNMGAIGNIMNNGLNKGSTGTIMALGMTGVEAIADKLASVFPKGVQENTGITADNLMNAVEQYLGVAPNPNPSVLFKGPELRDINFSWQFNPRNKVESMRIRKAIQKMKSSALPATTFGTDTGLLRYPHIAMLNFYPWDKSSVVEDGTYGWSETSFLRIKRCVISNITSNYAPTGAPSFFAGSHEPTFIQLNISLKEIEFFVAGDWDSSNAGIGFNKFDDSTVVGSGVNAALGYITEKASTLGQNIADIGGKLNK